MDKNQVPPSIIFRLNIPFQITQEKLVAMGCLPWLCS